MSCSTPRPQRRRWRPALPFVLAGEDGELFLPALKVRIRSLQERQLDLFQLTVSAGPDCLDYDEEIQRVNMAKKAELERFWYTAAAYG